MSKDAVWAFPKGRSDYSENRGMTLRDYMAAHASEEDVQVVMRAHTKQKMVAGEYMDICGVTRQRARYMHADAMLAERDR